MAALLAGCATPQVTAPLAASNDPLGLGDAVSPRYQTQALALSAAAVSHVDASSTRTGAWFSVANLTDGNFHSAWSPAANDPNPTLLVTLTQPISLSQLGIKLSDRGITFDVATAGVTGNFTTVATDVTPDYAAMDLVSVPVSQSVTQVKLTFHVPADRELLVCELKLFDGATAIANPAVTASPIPATSHHFYAEGDNFGSVFGPFRFRPGGNTYKLTFKSDWDAAHTHFTARIRAADGRILTTWTEANMQGYFYDRNYSLYGDIDLSLLPSFLGQDCYFEVLEATGYYQFVLANDTGFVTDAAR